MSLSKKTPAKSHIGNLTGVCINKLFPKPNFDMLLTYIRTKCSMVTRKGMNPSIDLRKQSKSI